MGGYSICAAIKGLWRLLSGISTMHWILGIFLPTGALSAVTAAWFHFFTNEPLSQTLPAVFGVGAMTAIVLIGLVAWLDQKKHAKERLALIGERLANTSPIAKNEDFFALQTDRAAVSDQRKHLLQTQALPKLKEARAKLTGILGSRENWFSEYEANAHAGNFGVTLGRNGSEAEEEIVKSVAIEWPTDSVEISPPDTHGMDDERDRRRYIGARAAHFQRSYRTRLVLRWIDDEISRIDQTQQNAIAELRRIEENG